MGINGDTPREIGIQYRSVKIGIDDCVFGVI